MLIITRKLNEVIRVKHAGETLVIRLAELHKNKISLGFEGPRSFDIARDELPERHGDSPPGITVPLVVNPPATPFDPLIATIAAEHSLGLDAAMFQPNDH